jgi:hypothetical protein
VEEEIVSTLWSRQWNKELEYVTFHDAVNSIQNDGFSSVALSSRVIISDAGGGRKFALHYNGTHVGYCDAYGSAQFPEHLCIDNMTVTIVTKRIQGQ